MSTMQKCVVLQFKKGMVLDFAFTVRQIIFIESQSLESMERITWRLLISFKVAHKINLCEETQWLFNLDIDIKLITYFTMIMQYTIYL